MVDAAEFKKKGLGAVRIEIDAHLTMTIRTKIQNIFI